MRCLQFSALATVLSLATGCHDADVGKTGTVGNDASVHDAAPLDISKPDAGEDTGTDVGEFTPGPIGLCLGVGHTGLDAIFIDTHNHGSDFDQFAIVGDLAYVARSGLHVYDVSDPRQPEAIGELKTGAPTGGLVVDVEKSLVYMTENTSHSAPHGLRVVDVSEPTAPTVVGFLATEMRVVQPSLFGDLLIAIERTWLSTPSMFANELVIFDVADPTAPTLLSRTTVGDVERFLVADDGRLYFSSEGTIHVLDVNTPKVPEWVATFPGPPVLDISLDATLIAGETNAEGGSTVVAVDVSQPLAGFPTLASWTVPEQGSLYVHAGVTDDGSDVRQLYVGNSGGLFRYDITDIAGWSQLGSPVLACGNETPVFSRGVSHIQMSCRTNGVRAIPFAAEPAWGSLPVGNASPTQESGNITLAVRGEYAYVATGQAVAVIDVSEPRLPIQTAQLESNNVWTHGVIVHQEHLVVSHAGYIGLWSLADPAHPTEGATVSAGIGPSAKLAIAGSRLLVTTSFNGLGTVDLSDPDAPGPMEWVELPLGLMPNHNSAALAVAPGATHAYLGTADGRVLVLTMASEEPSLVGEVSSGGGVDPGLIHAIAIDGLTMFARSDSGLTQFDITSPSAPVLVSYEPTPATNASDSWVPWCQNGIAASESSIFLTGGTDGENFRVFEATAPDQLSERFSAEFPDGPRAVQTVDDYLYVVTNTQLLIRRTCE